MDTNAEKHKQCLTIITSLSFTTKLGSIYLTLMNLLTPPSTTSQSVCIYSALCTTTRRSSQNSIYHKHHVNSKCPTHKSQLHIVVEKSDFLAGFERWHANIWTRIISLHSNLYVKGMVLKAHSFEKKGARNMSCGF